MKKICLYCRVSSREQMKGFGIDDQERRCRNYIDIYYGDEGYDLIVKREEGVSAKTIDRPRMSEVINMIKKKEIDVLVVLTYDRLTRRLKDFINLLELMEKKEVVLDSVKEKFNTSTATGRMFVHMLVAMSEWEEDLIGERTSRGLEESAKQGNYCLGAVPFGYDRKVEGRSKVLIINEQEAEVVRLIFDQIVFHDLRPYSVSLKLKENKVGFKKWTENVVLKIVRNKVYKGVFDYKGTEYNTVPRIVSDDVWNKANRMIDSTRYRVKQEYPFCGYVICKDCGTTMTGRSGTSKSKVRTVYTYYYCKKCKTYLSQNKLMEYSETVFSDMLTKQRKAIVDEQFKGKLASVQTAIRKHEYEFEHGTKIDKDVVLSELEGYRLDEIALLRKREEEYKQVQFNVFSSLSYDDKRKFLAEYVDEIFYLKDTKDIEIHLKKSIANKVNSN